MASSNGHLCVVIICLAQHMSISNLSHKYKEVPLYKNKLYYTTMMMLLVILKILKTITFSEDYKEMDAKRLRF